MMIDGNDSLQSRAQMFLRRFYGYTSFRPMQLDVITSVMSGRDTIVLMPTGGGKSITFQIPALMSEGCAIVVTPLISLMADQVAALRANGIPAATINSTVPEAENRATLDALYQGKVKLLYISPERLLVEMGRWSKDVKLSFIAIDEAHCISRWGHDFRPDYTRLGALKQQWPSIPIMALTATADKLTREDIAVQLSLSDPALFVSSFDRPNLSLNVMPNPGLKGRIRVISRLIEAHPYDSGIVYTLTRKSAESINEELLKKGFRSAVYHAGLSADTRMKAQRLFREGKLQVICATVAFGMGIDKSNIRWIVHNNMPPNIESYYQEIGRAGRDGLPAETIMFHSVSDIITIENFISESGQQEINREKLNRMKEYVDSPVCRRRVLLSYFNEPSPHDCGNCDVCLNPPAKINALIPVKKALSAIIRSGASVGANMLVDVLRGSAKADIISRGLHHIKTYGAGRDLPYNYWQSIILQMIQTGIVEIAYNNGNRLMVTPYGMSLLNSEEPLMLADPAMLYKPGARQHVVRQQPTLLDRLKELRMELAVKSGWPPEYVASDPSLEAIAEAKPRSLDQFAAIEGINDIRAVMFWRPFVKLIYKELSLPDAALKAHKSIHDTLFLLNRQYPVADIAKIRSIKQTTVYSHIAELVYDKSFTDYGRVITRQQIEEFAALRASHPQEAYEIFDKRYGDGLHSVALAIINSRL